MHLSGGELQDSIYSVSIKNSKIYDSKNIFYFKFNCWTQDFSVFTLKSTLSVCASSFQITLVYAEFWTRIGLQTICDVTNNARRPAS